MFLYEEKVVRLQEQLLLKLRQRIRRATSRTKLSLPFGSEVRSKCFLDKASQPCIDIPQMKVFALPLLAQ